MSHTLPLWLALLVPIAQEVPRVEDRAGAEAAAKLPENWKSFTPPDGRFSAKLPGEPVEQRKLTRTLAGEIEVLYYLLSRGDDGALLISSTPIPIAGPKTDPVEVLDGSRRGILARLPGSMLIQEKRFLLAGRAARDLEIEVPATAERPAAMRINARLLFADGVLYQLQAIQKVAETPLLSPEEIAGFHGSFQLVGQGKAGSGEAPAREPVPRATELDPSSRPTSDEPGPADSRSLKEAAAGRFKIGVGVGNQVIDRPAEVALIRRHFQILTPENDMKPQNLHPAEDRWNFGPADRFVAFARENDLEVVGHCLLWAKDDRTADWMMTEDGQPVGRETLLKRVEEHIATVVDRYADAATMWDVVNEAVADGGDEILRDSVYSRTTGIDFVVAAFKAAREHDPDALLIYNDYNDNLPGKREKVIEFLRQLKEKGAPVDAYGMQGHFEMSPELVPQIRATLDELRRLGLKVVVSELDIDPVGRGRWYTDDGKHREELAKYDPYKDGLPPEMQQKLADQYAALFRLFNEYDDIIVRVSFWNLHDGQSWLNYFPWRRTNHPLLFDRDLRPKPAFDAVHEALRAPRVSR
jgi:GH35 family endo-1,4-beta-xylanase